MKTKKLQGGMIGGALGAFIGPVHRMAATLDGQAEFVAGAFSRNPEKSAATGEALFIDPSRAYASWQEMLEKEKGKLDFISIVTVTASHYEIASACVEAGFNVICDKPMTTTLADAKDLAARADTAGNVFALTHNYTGYPMVKEAREWVRRGELGTINKVVVEYSQGWLSGYLRDNSGESGINLWRVDPKQSGGSCCCADIGIHAENLCHYITGLEIESVCADVSAFIPSNPLDDDVSTLLRFKGGAKGVLTASQILSGEENQLRIRIYGSKKSLDWSQEDPNYLHVLNPDGTRVRLSKGNESSLSQVAYEAGRLPFGHPDGFIEAFANVYMEAFKAIRAHKAGEPIEGDFPTQRDGVIGCAFIETVLESAGSDKKWTPMKE